ncbi:MAG: ferritin family protein [Phycisphaerae bacterium]
MSITFNADEVYRMAEQIETEGIRFYKAAAEQASSDSARNVLLNLAEMEAAHQRTFAAMREELNPSEQSPALEADDEGLQYLQAAVEGKVFKLDSDPAGQIGADTSMDEILRRAIGLEHDSIAFYTGMKQMMQSAADMQKVDHIIREEMGHVTMLTNLMPQS